MSRIEGGSLWSQAPKEFPRHVYDQRARQVYWHKDYPACRAKGSSHAECLLEPNHDGDHYGNGYDEYGPLGPHRWSSRNG